MEKPYRRFLHWFKWFFIVAIALFGVARIYYALTDDFRLSNITYPLPYDGKWEITKPTPEEEKQLKQILAQPFTYHGKGAQSYVFFSEDEKYVLKFFKFKHLRPAPLMRILPSVGFIKTYKEKQAARKERKLFGVFNSYKLAYDFDKKESGLIFVQLNTENNPPRPVTIIDKIGRKHFIDLQNYPFILQHKGESLRIVIHELLKKGNINTAKLRFAQILDLYAKEYQKGIYDHDHGVMQNTGFIGEQPIHLDVGKLLREENMKDKKEAKKDAELVVEKMNFWMKRNYPQYSEEIEKYLNDKLNELY